MRQIDAFTRNHLKGTALAGFPLVHPMVLPKLYWSSVVFVPALVALMLLEPIATLVAVLGLFALWVGLRSES